VTHILLIRHGHVPGITPEEFRGRRELQLTERGRVQARTTAHYLAQHWDPVAIYTSPMGRCVATGKEIAGSSHAPLSVLPELNDLDYGGWTGRTHLEVSQACPDEYRRWRQEPDLVQFPGGESLQDQAARIAGAMRRALERHADDTIVMVGHDSGNRVLLLQALRLPLSAYWRLTQDPCAISEVRLEGGRWMVVRINESAHLDVTESAGAAAGEDSSP
jgi:phosphoserine phosphatase